VATLTGLAVPTDEVDEGVYRTLSGFILHHLGHVPAEGESFVSGEHQIEITDTDRLRIDKVTIRRVGKPGVTEASHAA
jgi:putative hemolysin